MRYLSSCALLAAATFACGGAETQNTAVLAPPPTSTAAPAPSAAPAVSETATADAPPATPQPAGAAFCPPQGKIHFAGGDGSSMKSAVVILGARGEMDGVASEYTCLEAVYGPRQSGSWKLLSQSLLNDGGKSYDLMDVQLASGKTKKVFFDISDYFGKF